MVFEASSKTTGASVAVKVLLPQADTESVLDFENEGVLLRQLNPVEGVITYIDGGIENIDLHSAVGITVQVPVRYHVLAAASGSVDELILDPLQRSRLAWSERLRFWRDAILATRQMHAHGIAHRDLKCSNCLVMVSGAKSRLKLADLGRGKDLNAARTRPAEHYLAGRGDLRFAPPECLFLQAGPYAEHFLAADYYGLGSVLVELATGHPLTSLAMGDFRPVMQGAQADRAAGVHRDLSGLELRFRNVLLTVVDTMPKSIREDALVLLAALCQPVPEKRLPGSPFARDRQSKDPLDWVLRRADIMIKRIEVDILQERRARRRKAA